MDFWISFANFFASAIRLPALLDLRRQGGVKQQTMLIVFHRDLLFPFYL